MQKARPAVFRFLDKFSRLGYSYVCQNPGRSLPQVKGADRAQKGAKDVEIGWIGTGVMGGPMAGHLMKAGHSLSVFNRTREKAEGLLSQGATWADTPAAAAAGSAVIFTMVGYPTDVEHTYLGENGVFSTAQSGSVAVDMTTSSPALAEKLSQKGAENGVAVLDAPVSGGDIGARNATLSIMVGGARETFEKVKPLFELLGKTIVLQGPAGSGQHTKMVNQILVAGTMVSMCEGLLYAKRSGLDPRVVFENVSGGAAASWALSNLYPRILAGDLEPGFYVEHYIKDMGIALEEAARMDLALPGLSQAKQLYHAVLACGGARKGTQALMLALETLNGSGQMRGS